MPAGPRVDAGRPGTSGAPRATRHRCGDARRATTSRTSIPRSRPVRPLCGPAFSRSRRRPRAEAMPDVYADADVFCLPSWWEAMPLSILEAMASALPVVASAVGDIPRLVDEGVTGYVVPARDPALLAEALKRVCADHELA